ncbi:Tyrosine-protein kinase receptor Tie-1 [Holothuria leucospilota]|uniref:Tyrosine-protein kinase receptor Tie-1 n=1 Tax=Holothuria leucospilota TaxID=206669 RepID=A0A9Q1BB73_HOLLE|nr:Tyrosine-protein kinase receptor Tie-1 [Holothuria leucospilota]
MAAHKYERLRHVPSYLEYNEHTTNALRRYCDCVQGIGRRDHTGKTQRFIFIIADRREIVALPQVTYLGLAVANILLIRRRRRRGAAEELRKKAFRLMHVGPQVAADKNKGMVSLRNWYISRSQKVMVPFSFNSPKYVVNYTNILRTYYECVIPAWRPKYYDLSVRAYNFQHVQNIRDLRRSIKKGKNSPGTRYVLRRTHCEHSIRTQVRTSWQRYAYTSELPGASPHRPPADFARGPTRGPKIQPYVLVYPAAISLSKGGDLKMVQNFPSGFESYFSRARSTGTGVKIPSGTKVEKASSSTTITIPRDKSKRQERIGVFNYEMIPPSNFGSLTVTTVVHWRGKLSFPKATMTTYRGEDIRLSVEKRNRRLLRWRRNGKTVPKWNGRKSVKIENVQEWQAGIYECYRKKFRRLGQHAIIRVIVQACPRNTWGKPACNMNPAKFCLNGGVLNQEIDTCLCAPGFGGECCAQMYGPGIYGYNGEYHCPNDDCKGSLICQKDPFGCSCATGYQGPTCSEGCQEGTFGANCEGICHCSEGATCDPMTGICSSMICAMGWSGPNCQVEHSF